MIGALFDDLKHKVDGMLKLAVAGAVVSAAAMAAFICFVVALFLWTQQNYGTLEAWLALGGLFILVAALGGAVMLAVRADFRPIWLCRGSRRGLHGRFSSTSCAPS